MRDSAAEAKRYMSGLTTQQLAAQFLVQQAQKTQQPHIHEQRQQIANQIRSHGVAIYNKSIHKFAAKWGGKVENIPPD